MATSSFEIFGILFLVFVLVLIIWWYYDASRKVSTLSQNTYTRGANIKGSGGKVDLQCGIDHEICVYTATQICSSPDSNNFENASTDPISSGLNGDASYSEWNPSTTIDMKDTLGKSVNGKQKVTYTFTPAAFPNGMTCGSDNIQLVSTYDCVPKGTCGN